MRMLNFAKRNFKELVRDPLGLVFEIILPIFLLFIFQQINIPSENYKLENFTPGIVLFGFSFISLFTASLVSKDRSSSLLIRLGASPMKASDYILGYIISLIPIIVIQDVLFFLVAVILGLSFSVNIVYTILISLVVSVLFITMGILIGSLVGEKATGGVGSVVVQLVCFTSGMYFSLDLVGVVFGKVCGILPFESCLNIIKCVLNGNLDVLSMNNVIVFLIYTLGMVVLSVFAFKKKMFCDDK